MVIDSQITVTTKELSELMDMIFRKLRERPQPLNKARIFK